MKPKAVKDPRVRQKRAAQDFTATVEKVLTGEKSGRPGAEHHLFNSFKGLVQVFLMGEGPLADELRAVVVALMDPADPLRRDIPADTWAMLWPALNTLTHARNEAVRAQQQLNSPGDTTDGSEERRAEERSEEVSTAGAGPGVLGPGAGVVEEGRG